MRSEKVEKTHARSGQTTSQQFLRVDLEQNRSESALEVCDSILISHVRGSILNSHVRGSILNSQNNGAMGWLRLVRMIK